MVNLTQEQFFGGVTPEVTPQVTPEVSISVTDAQPAQTTVTQEQFFDQPAAVEEQGFLERAGGDLETRLEEAAQINQRVATGEISLLEGVASVFARPLIGGVVDVAGEALRSAGETISDITPEAVAEPVSDAFTSVMGTLSKSLNEIAATDEGKLGLEAIKAGGEVYQSFKKFAPRTAEQLENIGITTLALAPTPIKGARAAPTPGVVGRAGEAVGARGVAQEAAKRTEFVNDLIRPKQTAAVRAEQVGRTTEQGLLRQKVVAPSAQEAQIAAEVSLIPGVAPSKTLVGNFGEINKEVVTEAKSLKTLLDKNPVAIPKKEFKSELDKIGARLIEEDPTIVGDAAKSAQRVISKMKSIVDSNPGTAAGLLKSRKEIDAWVRQRSSKLLDPTTGTAMSTAVAAVRRTTNDFIDSKVPNVDVKDSLRKQSKLFDAMDNIKLKAADEGATVIERAWQNVQNVVTNKSQISQALATAVGIGGLGAAAAFAPVLRDAIIVGGLTFGARKALLSPKLKKGVSTLLKGVDQAIQKTTDPRLLTDLRADRVAILSLLNDGEEEK